MKNERSKPSLSELLRAALAEAPSVNSVAVATGVQKSSLLRFMADRQSLRLDKADILAAYFGIESQQRKRR